MPEREMEDLVWEHPEKFLTRRSRNQTGRKMEKLEPPVKCLQRPVDSGRNARPEIFSARKRDDSIG